MKMILELGTLEAKNSITSGAMLNLLEVMAETEKQTEAPAREFVQQFKDYAEQQAIQQPTAPAQQSMPAQPYPQQPAPQQAPMQQPVAPAYPSSLPGTAINPQPPTGPIQQQMPPIQQALTQQAPVQPQAIVPTSQAPAYTMDQLAVAATQLVDSGKMELLRGILQSFGVSALTELPKDRYGEFATVLRQQGVKI